MQHDGRAQMQMLYNIRSGSYSMFGGSAMKAVTFQLQTEHHLCTLETIFPVKQANPKYFLFSTK